MLVQASHSFSTSILIAGTDDHFFSYNQLPGSVLKLAAFQRTGSGKRFLYAKSLVSSYCPKDLPDKGRESLASPWITNSFRPNVTSSPESMYVLLMAKVSLKSAKHLVPSCSQGFYYYEPLQHCQNRQELERKLSQHEAPVPYVWQCPKIICCNSAVTLHKNIHLAQPYSSSLLPHLWAWIYPLLPMHWEGTDTGLTGDATRRWRTAGMQSFLPTTAGMEPCSKGLLTAVS